MDIFASLKQLSETPGPSAGEGPVAAVIAEMWQPLVDDISSDRLGSLVAVKYGRGPEPRPRLMLAAHADEIALMVSQIEGHTGSGFLRVTRIGGVDNRQLYGQLVTVHGRKDLPGVIGCLPAAMLPEDRRDKPFEYEDLVVDVGLPLSEVQSQVSIGDFVSFRQRLRKMQGSRATGKALDNRVSVAVVSACLEYLSGRVHHWDVLAVATAQEEVGLIGAATSAFALRPDAAVAVDVGFGKGPGANNDNTFSLGEGPMIGLGTNVHPGMYRALKEAAKALEMKVHTETHARASGTDAWALQVAREGIPTALVSVPLRYMHTMVETVDTTDIERAGRLLGEFVARLDKDFLSNLVGELMGE